MRAGDIHVQRTEDGSGHCSGCGAYLGFDRDEFGDTSKHTVLGCLRYLSGQVPGHERPYDAPDRDSFWCQ